MKKIFILLSIIGVLSLSGCAKGTLNTDPTDKVSGTTVFSSADNALSAVNGIYRLFYTVGWGSGWEHENGGFPAFRLVFDLMGEDHIMDNSGSGWFWYDYNYGVWGDYTNKAGRQYNVWNFFYTIISNANYILAYEKSELSGDKNVVDYVMAQAYAIRSFAYMWLVQSFQQNDPSKPGVPLYFEPTVAGSEGAGRGTVQNVYDQANADIDKAIALFEGSNQTQMHKSHIDKYVAYGLKARHALVQHDYATALEAAEKAMKGGTIAKFSDIRHLNSVAVKNTLWGLAIQTDQAMGNGDLFTHMDADCGSTYSKGRHIVSNWLYNQIPSTDARKAWWTAPIPEDNWGDPGTSKGSYRSYCQTKHVFIDAAAKTGDHVLMRVEEMYLTAAEAACHLKQYAKAAQYVSEVGKLRDSDYAKRLAGFVESSEYQKNTTAPLVTLMDEILFQRRVELWNEVPRLHDLQRLGLGFNRDWDGTNHTKTIKSVNTNPASPAFILWIPQAEFDGNANMDPNVDQNPDQKS